MLLATGRTPRRGRGFGAWAPCEVQVAPSNKIRRAQAARFLGQEPPASRKGRRTSWVNRQLRGLAPLLAAEQRRQQVNRQLRGLALSDGVTDGLATVNRQLRGLAAPKNLLRSGPGPACQPVAPPALSRDILTSVPAKQIINL